jgi:ketosteroid isomerase-like protein/quercetin dioxygenase-like cupin family protein
MAESLTKAPLAGALVAENHDGWSPELKEEFARHSFDGHVGSRLLFETNRVRVWEIRLAPGQRLHAHRHVLDYFWIATTAGRSRQHTSDGTTRDVSYNPGDSKYLTFDRGEYLLHDLNNIGDTELVFTTVEHLDSANEALPITSPVAEGRRALEALADAFSSAYPKADMATLHSIFGRDAVVWHNWDRNAQSLEKHLAMLEALSSNLRSMAYEKVRRHYFGHGWVQQHTVTGETQSGQTWEAEACVVFTVVDGRIQRLEEYIDPTQFAARG